MTTTANICILCDEMGHRIYATCDEMRRRVLHVTARLTTWNIGEVIVGKGCVNGIINTLATDAIAWMRISRNYKIAVHDDEGVWMPWHSAPLQLQLDTFARLPELVNAVAENLAGTHRRAEACKVACESLDTLLGTPAPASGGEGGT